MEERQLTDQDWAPLRDAVADYAPVWERIAGDSYYDATLPFCTIHAFAEFVVGHLLLCHRDVEELGDTIEALYTEAMIRDDESLEGLLTVGFLEGLIDAADDLGLPLTRIQPLLVGRQTQDAWERAIAWQRPDHVWQRGVGAVPVTPLPKPVGTVEVHRGWADREAGVCRMDVRLLSGALERGFVVRQTISKNFYSSWQIADVRLRSPELDDEFEIALVAEREEAYEVFEGYFGPYPFDHPYWQVAEPRG